MVLDAPDFDLANRIFVSRHCGEGARHVNLFRARHPSRDIQPHLLAHPLDLGVVEQVVRLVFFELKVDHPVKPDDNVSRVEVYVLESTAFADGYFARFSSHKPMVVFRFHTQNLAECLNSVKINLQLYSAVHHGVAKDKNKTVSNL
jgi:hypothetical protein